jgi:hypothetical protein
VTDRRLAQTVVVKRCGASKTPSHDHSITISSQPMTDHAKDLVTFPAAFQNVFSYLKRKHVHIIRERIGAAWLASC